VGFEGVGEVTVASRSVLIAPASVGAHGVTLGRVPQPQPPPPPPPPKLVETTAVVAVGTVVWLALWLALLAAHLIGGRPLDIWFQTTLVGWLLGLLGYSVFRWQRWAARTGRRGAQRGVD
jgi:hypothetical protein